MKIVFAAFWLAVFSLITFAQDFSIEKDFEKNKSKFRLEKFSEGEDATSGFDYLIYSSKSKIVKIRSIWNGGASSKPEVQDYYFRDGVLVLYVEQSAARKQHNQLVKGRSLKLAALEKLSFENSKLVAWFEKGKSIPNTDTRWADREKELLEQAQSQKENYQFLKEEKQ